MPKRARTNEPVKTETSKPYVFASNEFADAYAASDEHAYDGAFDESADDALTFALSDDFWSSLTTSTSTRSAARQSRRRGLVLTAMLLAVLAVPLGLVVAGSRNATPAESTVEFAAPPTTEATTVTTEAPTTEAPTTAAPTKAKAVTTSTTVKKTTTTTAKPKPTTTATVTPTTAAVKAQAPAAQAAPAPQPVVTSPPPTGSVSDLEFLACVRRRESGGNYGAVSPGGTYRGAYQFLQSTWDAAARIAGRPDLVGVPPNTVSPGDQDAVALAYVQAAGRGAWGGACG